MNGMHVKHSGRGFRQLRWQDLKDWAGARTVGRGQNYQRSGRVSELGRTSDNRLLARVTGGHRYTTIVSLDEDGLASRCTCPYGLSCKHAVAVVLEYLQRCKKRVEVPIVEADDPKLEVGFSLH